MKIEAAQATIHAGTVPPHFGLISISAASVCLALAYLFGKKPFKKAEAAIPWLMLVAGLGLSAAFLRSWIHSLAGFERESIPTVGDAIPVVVAIVLAYIVFYDLWPKHESNKTTKVAALLLPSFAPEIGGAVGHFLGSALGALAVAGARLIGAMFGV